MDKPFINSMKTCNSVSFNFMKNWFSDISRKCILPNFIHWVPLKTQHKFLCNLSKFQWVNFPEIFTTNGKYCCRKVTKISGKRCWSGQKWHKFFWSNPKSQLHKVILRCGKHTHDIFHVVFFFLCWLVVLWHFLQVFVVCCSFSSIFKHHMLLRTCANCLDCPSEGLSRQISCEIAF